MGCRSVDAARHRSRTPTVQRRGRVPPSRRSRVSMGYQKSGSDYQRRSRHYGRRQKRVLQGSSPTADVVNATAESLAAVQLSTLERPGGPTAVMEAEAAAVVVAAVLGWRCSSYRQILLLVNQLRNLTAKRKSLFYYRDIRSRSPITSDQNWSTLAARFDLVNNALRLNSPMTCLRSSKLKVYAECHLSWSTSSVSRELERVRYPPAVSRFVGNDLQRPVTTLFCAGGRGRSREISITCRDCFVVQRNVIIVWPCVSSPRTLIGSRG